MIRVYMVDDERPARERLRQLLDSFGDVEIIGEAGDGDEAVRGIAELHPDLVFLDIQMPGRSGLEVAASLVPPRPRVVFCTAFDEYAISAFELHAVDYLLKPVSRHRLNSTVERVRHSLGEATELFQDLESARDVQSRMFPRQPLQLETLDYCGACLPARSVGGDYYDFLPLGPRKLGIALADVAGKGIAAALLMASLQGRLQSSASGYGDAVGELMSDLNRAVLPTTGGSRFITMFYGVYDDATRTLTYSNAGHNPPLVIGDAPRRLDRGGTVLGCFRDVSYEQETVSLSLGDVLVAFSDGVTEASSSDGDEFGELRVGAITSSHASLSAQGLRDRILDEVATFTGDGTPHDDRTLVVAKVDRSRAE